MFLICLLSLSVICVDGVRCLIANHSQDNSKVTKVLLLVHRGQSYSVSDISEKLLLNQMIS